MIKKCGIALTILLVFGCKSIRVDKQNEYTTYAKIELGVLGFHENAVARRYFNVKGIPDLEQKIKLFVRREPFTEAAHAAYIKASPENMANVVFNDSLLTKPSFLSIRLADHIGYINALNRDKNLQDFLLKQENIYVVNSISIVFPAELQQEIEAAESVFLTNKNFKQYQLELVTNGKTTKALPFITGKVFAFGLTYPCWGENQRYDVVVKELVRQYTSCSKGLQKDATKVKKKLAINKL